MAVSQQYLNRIEVSALKNLKDVDISFEGSPVTAILGPNGNGKSTILHALACAFSPNNGGESYKFSWFFLPNPDALWKGSELRVFHSYREGAKYHEKIPKDYSKKTDRWSPRYAKRPKRDIYYIGVDKCVPMIEAEKKQARLNYSTKAINEEVVEKILRKASFVLNRKYLMLNVHTESNREFIGVEVEGVRYSALSMSAGEQKVFYILEKVFRADKYSLILVDELDLLLHDQALKRLIKVVVKRSEEKNLQVVFTTHRETVLELERIINIRHLFAGKDRTLCFNETKPDAINRLTGKQPKPLEVFVEDDLSAAIVWKITSHLKISKYVSVLRYGAAVNCFTALAGLAISSNECDNCLFVLDGDVYSTNEEKREALEKVLTGNDYESKDLRDKMLEKVCQFSLPEGNKPEEYIHSILLEMEGDNEEHCEVVEVARDINSVDDDHKYIDDIIERLGWERSVGLSKIVDLISESSVWGNYVKGVQRWLSSKVGEVRE